MEKHAEKKTIDFLIEAYKSAISLYNGYMNRIWNRFSIIITIDAALAGIFLTTWFKQESNSSKILIFIPILGLIISFILYIQSVQDRFIIRRFRIQIDKLKNTILIFLEGDKDLANIIYPFFDEEIEKKSFVFEDITSWRHQAITLTRIPGISSIIIILFWIILIIVLLFN